MIAPSWRPPHSSTTARSIAGQTTKTSAPSIRMSRYALKGQTKEDTRIRGLSLDDCYLSEQKILTASIMSGSIGGLPCGPSMMLPFECGSFIPQALEYCMRSNKAARSCHLRYDFLLFLLLLTKIVNYPETLSCSAPLRLLLFPPPSPTSSTNFLRHANLRAFRSTHWRSD
jgi:hypothetical protein